MSWWRALVDLFSDRYAGYTFAAGLAPMFAAPPPYPAAPEYINPYTGLSWCNPYTQQSGWLGDDVELANANFWARITAGAAAQRAWDDLLTEPKPWGD